MNVTLKTHEYLNGYDQECIQFYLEIENEGTTHALNVLRVPKSYYPAQISTNWKQARESIWGALVWQQGWLRNEGIDHWGAWEAYNRS